MNSNLLTPDSQRIARSYNLGELLRKVFIEHSVWSQVTFGSDDELGPKNSLNHIKKEVDECLKDLDNPYEYADIFILLMDAWRRQFKMGVDVLLCYVEVKLKVVKTRKYNKPIGDEPCEHVRELDESVTTKAAYKD